MQAESEGVKCRQSSPTKTTLQLSVEHDEFGGNRWSFVRRPGLTVGVGRIGDLLEVVVVV